MTLGGPDQIALWREGKAGRMRVNGIEYVLGDPTLCLHKERVRHADGPVPSRRSGSLARYSALLDPENSVSVLFSKGLPVVGLALTPLIDGLDDSA